MTRVLIDKNNPYASRTLMFLNEAAEHFHKEQQAGSGPIKSFAVSDYLQSEYGLGARMATHGAAIICPDHKSKTFRHRKS
ncbi:hypothetical protein FQZ97_1019840 [compost metagenome]